MCSSLVAMWFHCRWLEKGQGKDALKWGINRRAHCSAWGESACQWSPNLFPSRSVFTPITDLISIKSPLAAAAACPPPHHTVRSPCLTDKWTRTHKPHCGVCKMEAVGFNLLGSFFMCIKGYYPHRHPTSNSFHSDGHVSARGGRHQWAQQQSEQTHILHTSQYLNLTQNFKQV